MDQHEGGPAGVSRRVRVLRVAVYILIVCIGMFFAAGSTAALVALVGLLTAAAIDLSGRAVWLRVLRELRLVLPPAAFVVSLFAFSDRRGSVDFYTAAAQILPVIVLPLALEGKFFSIGRIRDSAELRAAAATLFLLGYGEYLALRVVSTGRIHSGDLGMVAGTMLAGFAGVVIAALLSREELAAKQGSDRPNRRSGQAGT